MSTMAVVLGLGVAAVGITGRMLMRHAPAAVKNAEKVVNDLPKMAQSFSLNNLTDVKYYKGGFDPKMTKREAALILGVSPNAPKIKVKEAHKRIMLLNHPDRGGSPYVATKLNEAKDVIEKAGRQ